MPKAERIGTCGMGNGGHTREQEHLLAERGWPRRSRRRWPRTRHSAQLWRHPELPAHGGMLLVMNEGETRCLVRLLRSDIPTARTSFHDKAE